MTLPKRPKKEAKTSSVTVRLGRSVSEHLRTLAKEHGLSQAEVITFLIENEYKKWTKTSGSEL